MQCEFKQLRFDLSSHACYLATLMLCIFAKVSDVAVRCARCGREIVTDERPAKIAARCRSRGLGDMVADGLAAVGITKERVSKAIGRPCGCGKRQEKFNELGRKFGIG